MTDLHIRGYSREGKTPFYNLINMVKFLLFCICRAEIVLGKILSKKAWR